MLTAATRRLASHCRALSPPTATAAARARPPQQRRPRPIGVRARPSTLLHRARPTTTTATMATKKAETPVAWPSPITSDLLTAASVPRSEVAFGPDGALWWVEGRPAEGGRSVLCRRDVLGGGPAADVTPPVPEGREGASSSQPAFNVRTRVHEYGGGAYVLLPDPDPAGGGGTLAVWSNFGDSRLYTQAVPAGWDGQAASLAPPTLLTPAEGGLRFADGAADPARPGRAVFVVEDHGAGASPTEPLSYLAAVDLASGAVTRLTHCEAADAAGAARTDFVSTPRLSPDGSALAWVGWNHPNMPWDSTALFVARVDAATGGLADARRVAGGDAAGESVVEPVWVPAAGGRGAAGLAFISDRTDWWSVYFTPGALPGAGAGDAGAAGVRHLTPGVGEWAGPQWVLGLRQLQWVGGPGPDAGRLLARWADPAAPGARAMLVPVQAGGPAAPAPAPAPVPAPFTGFGRFAAHSPDGGATLVLATVGSSPDRPAELATVRLDGRTWAAAAGGWTVHARAADVDLDAGFISRPQAFEFPTDPLPQDDASSPPRTAFLNYYPPAHPDHTLPANTAPPVLFRIHGGPTAQSPAAFALGTLFWTSRGYGVADVNYGGSSGQGRAFRNRLQKNWGVVDVADVAAAAKFLSSTGRADPNRCCITGGSAGGFTVMAALAFRPGVFAAGASHYGVADCTLLASDTHKFESRYLDGLIGRFPDEKQTYVERSPIHSLDRVVAPLALFQGADDKVVPPNQAELAFKELKARGIPTTLVMFEGEGHGFRAAPNIRSAIEGELRFYGRTLGFDTGAWPAGLTEPEIFNLPPRGEEE